MTRSLNEKHAQFHEKGLPFINRMLSITRKWVLRLHELFLNSHLQRSVLKKDKEEGWVFVMKPTYTLEHVMQHEKE